MQEASHVCESILYQYMALCNLKRKAAHTVTEIFVQFTEADCSVGAYSRFRICLKFAKMFDKVSINYFIWKLGTLSMRVYLSFDVHLLPCPSDARSL